ELALLLRLEALGGERREHVIEGPGVAHAGDRAIGREHELAFHGDPDVRMSGGRRGCARGCRQRHRDGEKETFGHAFGSPSLGGTISRTAAEWRRNRRSTTPRSPDDTKVTRPPPRRRRADRGRLRGFRQGAAPPRPRAP